MGGNRSNVKSSGGLPPSGDQRDCREDGSAYNGQRVGMSLIVRLPGYSRSMDHQGVHPAS